jgi:hypothetical protein
MTQLNVDPDRYSIVGGAGEFVDVGGQMQSISRQTTTRYSP